MTGRLETGAAVIAALRAAADRRQIPLTRFIAPITASPTRWIKDVEAAHHPREVTLARVRALLAGETIPDRQGYTRTGQYRGRRVSPDNSHRGQPRVDFVPVDRDPCFLCGVRGDIGCEHKVGC